MGNQQDADLLHMAAWMTVEESSSSLPSSSKELLPAEKAAASRDHASRDLMNRSQVHQIPMTFGLRRWLEESARTSQWTSQWTNLNMPLNTSNDPHNTDTSVVEEGVCEIDRKVGEQNEGREVDDDKRAAGRT